MSTNAFTNAPPPKHDPQSYGVERLKATITFNGTTLTIGGAVADLCWHLANADNHQLTMGNRDSVLPPTCRDNDGARLFRAADSLRNAAAFRSVNKGDDGDPITYGRRGEIGLAQGVQVRFTFKA